MFEIWTTSVEEKNVYFVLSKTVWQTKTLGQQKNCIKYLIEICNNLDEQNNDNIKNKHYYNVKNFPLQCSVLKCCSVHYSAGLSSAVDYSLLQCGSVGSCKVQCSVVQHRAEQQHILSKSVNFKKIWLGLVVAFLIGILGTCLAFMGPAVQWNKMLSGFSTSYHSGGASTITILEFKK